MADSSRWPPRLQLLYVHERARFHVHSMLLETCCIVWSGSSPPRSLICLLGVFSLWSNVVGHVLVILYVGFKKVIKEETQKNRYEKVSLPPTGETLSLLVLRTAPGLGNVTVDWTLEGPLVPRTFSKSSGTLFFTEVNPKITTLGGGGVLVAPQGVMTPPSPPPLTGCFLIPRDS